MKIKNRSLFLFLAFIFIVNMSCAGLVPQATATAVPTNTPVPTRTAVATRTAQAGPPSVPESIKFELDGEMHDHPSGAFAFYAPIGWTIEETDFDVYIKDPKSGVFFYASVTNTGIPLEPDGHESFVNMTDDFYYASFDNYVQTSYSASEAKDVVVIEKTYTFEGKTQFVRSVYNQFGPVSYVFELLGTESIIKKDVAYEAIFDKFVENLVVDPDAGATRPIYEPSWTFVGPDNSMSISVPLGWTYLLDDHETYSDAVIESLNSPDGAALIENISVVDGNAYTMGNASEMALFLLNDRYSNGGGDVRVLDIKTLNDGSEYWTWKSTKGGYSGTTNFELRDGGSQVLLLSFVTYNETLELYNPLFDRVLSSYSIP